MNTSFNHNEEEQKKRKQQATAARIVPQPALDPLETIEPQNENSQTQSKAQSQPLMQAPAQEPEPETPTYSYPWGARGMQKTKYPVFHTQSLSDESNIGMHIMEFGEEDFQSLNNARGWDAMQQKYESTLIHNRVFDSQRGNNSYTLPDDPYEAADAFQLKTPEHYEFYKRAKNRLGNYKTRKGEDAYLANLEREPIERFNTFMSVENGKDKLTLDEELSMQFAENFKDDFTPQEREGVRGFNRLWSHIQQRGDYALSMHKTFEEEKKALKKKQSLTELPTHSPTGLTRLKVLGDEVDDSEYEKIMDMPPLERLNKIYELTQGKTPKTEAKPLSTKRLVPPPVPIHLASAAQTEQMLQQAVPAMTQQTAETRGEYYHMKDDENKKSRTAWRQALTNPEDIVSQNNQFISEGADFSYDGSHLSSDVKEASDYLNKCDEYNQSMVLLGRLDSKESWANQNKFVEYHLSMNEVYEYVANKKLSIQHFLDLGHQEALLREKFKQIPQNKKNDDVQYRNQWMDSKVAASLDRGEDESKQPGSIHAYLEECGAKKQKLDFDAVKFRNKSFDARADRIYRKNATAYNRLAILAREVSETEFLRILSLDPITRANEIYRLTKGKTWLNTSLSHPTENLDANIFRSVNNNKKHEYKLVKEGREGVLLKGKMGIPMYAAQYGNVEARKLYQADFRSPIGSDFIDLGLKKRIDEIENMKKNQNENEKHFQTRKNKAIQKLWKEIIVHKNINSYQRPGRLIANEQNYMQILNDANTQQAEEIFVIAKKEFAQIEGRRKSVSVIGHEMNHAMNQISTTTTYEENKKDYYNDTLVLGGNDRLHFSKPEEFVNAMSLLKQYTEERLDYTIVTFDDALNAYSALWNPEDQSKEMEVLREALPMDIKRLFSAIEFTQVRARIDATNVINIFKKRVGGRALSQIQRELPFIHSYEDLLSYYQTKYQPSRADAAIQSERKKIPEILTYLFKSLHHSNYYSDQLFHLRYWVENNDIMDKL